jgi:twitching motility two-component system response regulator PilH
MPRVLIVDDSPTEIHVIKTMLEKNGFDISTAESGEAGIEVAKSEKPDIILMDVVMPGLNGFQATRQLTNDPDTSSIPIIIVTTKNQETDRAWGLRQGAKDYLTKPVAEADLVAKINEYL